MRVGIAALVEFDHSILLGRRGKDPNRGLYVLPGGGVKPGELLERAVEREVLEETGLSIMLRPGALMRPFLIELPDRLVVVVRATPEDDGHYPTPVSGSDLYDVAWHPTRSLPWDISPVVAPVLSACGFTARKAKPDGARS
jgi:ADP-ribose pyrophosphatase YjhB (NUDIX family)